MTKNKIKALKRAYQNHAESEDVFFPTRRDFLYWFTFINSACFGNYLQMPKLKIERLRGKFGEAIELDEGETLIRLQERFYEHKTRFRCDSSRQMFINTVAHEMVHCLEFQMFGTMSHGEFYKIWKKKFKKIGIML